MLKASKHEAGSKIRSRQRAVADDDVDRPQVQAWRHVQPSGTNCPNVPVNLYKTQRKPLVVERVTTRSSSRFHRAISKIPRMARGPYERKAERPTENEFR